MIVAQAYLASALLKVSGTFLFLWSDFAIWDSLVFGSKYFILCVKGWLEATDSKYVLEKRLENSVFRL